MLDSPNSQALQLWQARYQKQDSLNMQGILKLSSLSCSSSVSSRPILGYLPN